MAKKIPVKDQMWINARKQFRLSDVHIQMARELGMNPKKFGKVVVKSVEQIVKERNRKREERKIRKAENE